MKVGEDAYAKAVAAWQAANGASTATVESALEDAVRVAVRELASPDVAAYIAHCEPHHVTWFGTQALDATVDAATQVTAAKLAEAIRAQLSSLANRLDVKSYPHRMRWLEAHLREVTPEVTTAPFGKRILAAVDLSPTAVASYANPGIFPNGRTLDHFNRDAPVGLDTRLEPSERAMLGARHRDINNIVWTETCYAVAQKTASLDIDSAERYGEEQTAVRGMLSAAYDFVVTPLLRSDRFTTVPECVGTSSADGRELIDNFAFVVPIGDFGEPLARAISEAARIMIAASEGMGDLGLDSRVQRWLSFQPASDIVLREGIASIAQAFGTLLAKAPAPPFDTARAALAEVARSRLLTQMAAMAPFAVVGPMAMTGTVAVEPCPQVTDPARPESARLRLPPALVELYDVVKAHPERTADSDPLLRTQTARGCPIAGRGPMIGPDGTIRMSDDAGLTVLVNVFAELALKLLDKHEAKA